jgi:tetratricopeptide (TPR) repeat protein
MAKVGRNEPCPCGSGKKYKRCCLAKQTRSLEEPIHVVLEIDPDPLDDLSNAALETIQQGKLVEAERLCQQLAQDHPDMIDPLARYASLYEAKGDTRRAAEFCRRAADFANTHEGFEPEVVEDFLARARELEARV